MEAAVEGTKIKFGTRGAPEGMQKDARDLPFGTQEWETKPDIAWFFVLKWKKGVFSSIYLG